MTLDLSLKVVRYSCPDLWQHFSPYYFPGFLQNNSNNVALRNYWEHDWYCRSRGLQLLNG